MSESTLRLMQEASRARSEERLADAHRCLIEAVALCRAKSNSPLLVRALKMLGQIERDLGRDEAALPLYEEALLMCRAADDALTIAHTVRHVGDIHQDVGRLDLAEECYQRLLTFTAIMKGRRRSTSRTRCDRSRFSSSARDTWRKRSGCGQKPGPCTRPSTCGRVSPRAKDDLLNSGTDSRGLPNDRMKLTKSCPVQD